MTETWEPELCDDKPEEFTKTSYDRYAGAHCKEPL